MKKDPIIIEVHESDRGCARQIRRAQGTEDAKSILRAYTSWKLGKVEKPTATIREPLLEPESLNRRD